jgi:predicted dehydrogenase
MNKKIRWGILSTAKIGREKVIPALQNSKNCEVIALASRDLENAKNIASQLSIPTAHGSYEDLIANPDVDAIYNPLPNHLHLKYTILALKAGKHVLCEKPIGMNQQEAKILLKEVSKHPHLKLMEAFMYKFHPQWIKAKELVKQGVLGEVKNIQTFFSYNNTDENNIRNKADVGGGALMDIGCYCVSFPRFIIEKEPLFVIGNQTIHPDFNVDTLTSGTLFFENEVTANFTCTTKLFPYQRTNILGDKGRIEIDMPCNAPLDEPTKITIYTASGEETLTFEANQYVLQCEAFADAIINNKTVPYPIDDAFLNMKVIDAIIKSDLEKSKVSV